MLAVSPTSFTAVATDLTEPSNPDENLEIDLEEVSPIDRPLMQPGVSFYWIIGTSRTPSGQQHNMSTLRFKRSPRITNAAYQRSRQWAQRMSETVNPEG